MAKHFLFVLLITIVASVLLRLILANVAVTATWLQDITLYNK